MKGFSTLLLLFMMPVILSLIVISTSSYLLISTTTKIQSLCRDTLLRTQSQLAQSLNQILKLNPKAQLLRQQEAALLVALAAATGNPPLMAELMRRITLNRLSQKKLRMQMTTLQKAGELLALKSYLSQSKLKGKNIPKLHLKHIPPYALAPDFLPQDSFEKKQHLSLSWSVQTQDIFEQFLKIPKVENSCSATLYRKDRKWLPILSADKS